MKRLIISILIALLIITMPVSIVLASTQYEHYTTGDDLYAQVFWADSPGADAVTGQTFTASSNHTITSVKIKVYKHGSPSTINVYLMSTSGGHPYQILRSNSFDGNTLTTNTAGEWKEITFTSYTLSSGTKYAIVCFTASAKDSSNYMGWRYDSTSPTYSGGNVEFSDDGFNNWTSYTNADLMFDVYGESLVVAPTVTTQAVSAIGSTTATGNGNITATGGENCTKRGVVYDTASHGNPGNVSPAASAYDFYEEETGSFSTGAFTASLTGLDVGETYYVRAYAYNTAGYTYGDEVYFTTDMTVPVIVVNDASNITKNVARLNSTLSDDGGMDCEVRFGYDDETHDGDFEAYDDDPSGAITDWVGGYSTGQHPYYDASSLTADTTYYFSVQVRNDEGTVTSDEETFTTEAAVAAPSNFKGIPQSTSISLSWVKGAGASRTMIRYSFDSYPATEADGIQLYFSTGSNASHTGLPSGQTVYYTAFSESEAIYSAGVNLLVTTEAGSATGVDVDSPSMPTNWFLDTDYTTMSNFEPLYSLVNDSADAIDMPRSTAWYLSALVFCVACAFATYKLAHNEIMPAGIMILITMGLMSAVQLVPLYMLFITLAVIIGVGMARRSI